METRTINQKESDVYNILITPSSEHFYPTLVVMLSAMLNCKKGCRFFIMQCDWTDEQKRTCEDIVSEYPGNKVEFINVDNSVFSSDCFIPYKEHYEAYYKLIVHNYLPNDVEKILYFDTDVLIRKDIAELYNIDLEDAFLSANLNPTFNRGKQEDYAKVEKKGTGALATLNYFSCGCNMLNVKKFKENKITPEFYDESVKKAGYTPLFVEGMLNLLFWDKVKLFPFYYYNFSCGFFNQYREIKDIYNSTNAQERAATYNPVYIEDLDENKVATIVHFVGLYLSKPWQTVYKSGTSTNGSSRVFGFNCDSDIEPLYLEWWETARKLPPKLYEDLVSNAHDEFAQQSIKFFTGTENVKAFFKSLSLDRYNGSHKFDDFVQSIKNKKLSVLNHHSEIGEFFTQIAERNGIDIVLKSPVASMTRLNDEEWEACKKADVIVSCYIYGGAELERENIKGILLLDIFND